MSHEAFSAEFGFNAFFERFSSTNYPFVTVLTQAPLVCSVTKVTTIVEILKIWSKIFSYKNPMNCSFLQKCSLFYLNFEFFHIFSPHFPEKIKSSGHTTFTLFGFSKQMDLGTLWEPHPLSWELNHCLNKTLFHLN